MSAKSGTVQALAGGVCAELVGREPDRIETPGGESRDSVRAFFGERSLIVTRRKHSERARLETLVLRALNEAGVAVPRLIASDGDWLLQQDLGQRRLSEALEGAGEVDQLDYLHQALSTLIHAHRAGAELGLPEHLVTLGETPAWMRKLIDRRLAIDNLLGLQAPDLPLEALMDMLRVRQPHFIKWDARPGNAVTGEDRQVFWIDWEHCGCRNSLDDLVWLLADEYCPCSETTEAALLETWLGPFSADWSAEEARDYFYTYGSLHSLVRLHYILRHKGDGRWWDHQRCLELDKVGVTREHALRLCRRIRRWVEASSLLGELGPWIVQVEEKIPGD